MRIRIVLASQNAGWVIGKIAYRLRDGLLDLGHAASVSEEADATADINHWMSFAFADGCAGTINTMFVTHADDPYKVRLIRELLEERVQMALCMSPQAADELVHLGIPVNQVWHVLPAIDIPVTPRKIRIGITTRVYDDGRKREWMLSRLAQDMSLSDFHFEIFGSGWTEVADRLRLSGARVDVDAGSDDWQGDYQRIRESVPYFDYYLYLGMDEGSLGTLDAVSAGVKTIVTAQGFHLSIPGGIDIPFTEYEELLAAFRRMAADRREKEGRLRSWSWKSYATEHAMVWSTLLQSTDGRGAAEQLSRIAAVRGEVPPLPLIKAGKIAAGGIAFQLRMLSPKRLRGAVARSRILRPIRRFMGF